ncbi:MAG TPA: hypothetical protein V6C97_30230 [Oculatellaceae cyanobacterium]
MTEGAIDSIWLSFYAIGLFGAGFLADKLKLNAFLGGGMLLVAACLAMVGLGQPFGMHSFWYFAIFNVFFGLGQATGVLCIQIRSSPIFLVLNLIGWPSCVSAMGTFDCNKSFYVSLLHFTS